MGLNLLATVSLDGSGFQSGLSKIESLAGGLQSQIAGAFSVGAITSITKKTLDYAGHLNDMSDKLGVSTDFLQEFRYAAKQTGTDLEKLGKVMEELNLSRDAALGGDAKKLAQFQALGVSPQQLRTMRLEDLIAGPIANALKSGDVQGKLGAAWKEIGGKGATSMIAAFKDGFDVEEIRKKAHMLTEDQIQQLDELGDAFAVLGDTILTSFGGVILKIVDIVRMAATFIQASFAWFANLVSGGGMAAGNAQFAETFQRFAVQLSEEMQAREARRRQRAADRAPHPNEAVQPEQQRRLEQQIHRQEAQGDSLTRIGNFLGGSRDTLARISELQLNYLRIIADNTRRIGPTGGVGFPNT